MENARTDARATAAELIAEEVGDLLTVAEVAKIMRVTTTKVYNAAHGGEFGELVRVGRAIRIPAAGFRAYMAASVVAA